MASYPTARLRALFGVPLDQVDRPALELLVDSGVGEDFDLDFKRAIYATGDPGNRELAKDIAAMTERGGIIILGLAERVTQSDAKLIDVDLSDAVASRMRQAVAARVEPMPEFDLVRVPATAETGQWLIVVPASPHQPHAVSTPGETWLHYFTRHGSTTRELSESEIADRYRRRFAAGAEAASRATTIFNEGVARLTLAERTWIAMALVPDRSGIVEINRAELERHRQWSGGWQESAPQARVDLVAMRAQTVGFRRLIVSQQMVYHGVSEYGHCELHADGSSFIAHVIGRPVDAAMTSSYGNVPIQEREHIVDQGDLAHAVIAMLSMISTQAVEFAGASGDGTLVVSLVIGGDADGRVDACPLHLLEWGPVGPRRVPGSRPVSVASQSWRTTPLAVVAADAGELVATAHGVITDVLSEFGQSDWLGTQPGGVLVPEGFGEHNAQMVSQWARANGLIKPDA
jgi:hypothetical protein